MVATLILIGLQVLGFVIHVYYDFNGRQARAPLGFAGFIGTVLICGLLGVLYWKLGCYAPLGLKP